ncbi:hypothetical protein PROFUN_15862 [Planoprotostelium fungivorum]|uniref:Phytanoyl-CoA dioxygenase n=1 Tax=Planoprotostelium fungivorum TaxID=1890364 RepID=A0A2P6MU56_9EUKA|nr:hypothetical protein PROFUN_15862 [Planoprotostelium fungivorum]
MKEKFGVRALILLEYAKKLVIQMHGHQPEKPNHILGFNGSVAIWSYVIIPDFIPTQKTDNEVDTKTMRDQAFKLRNTTDYFISSGDKVRFFFEEDAVDATGRLVVEESKATNKIGHDPIFRKFSGEKKVSEVSEVSKALGMKDPIIIQSMLIFKQPRIGGTVNIHQDSTFIKTNPMTCAALWFPLEDATLENGCIWAVPSSHKDDIVDEFVLTGDKRGATMEKAKGSDKAPWDTLAQKFSRESGGWVPLPCPAGSCLVIHGELVHLSDENTKPCLIPFTWWRGVPSIRRGTGEEREMQKVTVCRLQRGQDKPFPTFEQLSA